MDNDTLDDFSYDNDNDGKHRLQKSLPPEPKTFTSRGKIRANLGGK